MYKRQVKNFFYAITPMFLQIADRGAEVGDDGKIKLTYVLIGMVCLLYTSRSRRNSEAVRAGSQPPVS